MGHGPVFVPLKADLLLGVAVPEKNGIVHGDAQLQNGGQRLGYVGNLAHKEVAAQVVENRHADAHQEDERDDPGIHKQHHNRTGQHHRQGDVNGFLMLAQAL